MLLLRGNGFPRKQWKTVSTKRNESPPHVSIACLSLFVILNIIWDYTCIHDVNAVTDGQWFAGCRLANHRDYQHSQHSPMCTVISAVASQNETKYFSTC